MIQTLRFRLMHQRIITKIKKLSLLIVKKIVEHNIKLCECYYRRK